MRKHFALALLPMIFAVALWALPPQPIMIFPGNEPGDHLGMPLYTVSQIVNSNNETIFDAMWGKFKAGYITAWTPDGTGLMPVTVGNGLQWAGNTNSVLGVLFNQLQFDTPGGVLTFIGGSTNSVVNNFYTTNLFVTNLYATTEYVSNLFVTNITAITEVVSNLFVTNLTVLNSEFVTNLYVTNLTVENITFVTNTTFVSSTNLNLYQFSSSFIVDTNAGTTNLSVSLLLPPSPFLLYSDGFGISATGLRRQSDTFVDFPNGTMSMDVGVFNGQGASEFYGGYTNYGLHVTPFGANILHVTTGTNNVDTTTHEAWSVVSDEPTATNCIVQLMWGGDGAWLRLVNVFTNGFWLKAGSECWDDASKHVYLRGDWIPSEVGESIDLFGTAGGWDEIGRRGPPSELLSASEFHTLYEQGHTLVYSNSAPIFRVYSGAHYVDIGNAGGPGFLASDTTISILANGTGATMTPAGNFSPVDASVGLVLGVGTNYWGGLLLGTNGVAHTYTDNGSDLLRDNVPVGSAISVTYAAVTNALSFDGDAGKVLSAAGTLIPDPARTVFSVPDSSLIYTNVFVGNLPAGTNDIFTVPAGYNFYMDRTMAGTTNQSNIVQLGVKTNGNYYFTYNNLTVSTQGVQQAGLWSGSWLFSQNETVVITNSLQGLNFNFFGALFSTNFPVKMVKLFSLSAGDNVIYTVPNGKRFFGFDTATANQMIIVNKSGTTRHYKINIVPPGGVVSSDNLYMEVGAQANNSQIQFSFYSSAAGTSFVVNSDASTSEQFVFFLAYER